jgi:hypothetical protein
VGGSDPGGDLASMVNRGCWMSSLVVSGEASGTSRRAMDSQFEVDAEQRRAVALDRARRRAGSDVDFSRRSNDEKLNDHRLEAGGFGSRLKARLIGGAEGAIWPRLTSRRMIRTGVLRTTLSDVRNPP